MSERPGKHRAVPAGDFGPPERYRRQDPIVIEPAGRSGAVRARVTGENALDWYFRRRHLDTADPEGNRLLHESGVRLRADWMLAGLEPGVTARYADFTGGGGVQDFMRVREDAYRRWRAAIRAVGPIAAREVIDVCCTGHRVGRTGLEILRRGLAQLARHYGLENRS